MDTSERLEKMEKRFKRTERYNRLLLAVILLGAGVMAFGAVKNEKVVTAKCTQWEYGHYEVHVSVRMTEPLTLDSKFEWADATGRYKATESAQDLWRQTGFNFGNKKVSLRHWFNYLGEMAWELVSADESTQELSGGRIETRSRYWFKRPKIKAGDSKDD